MREEYERPIGGPCGWMWVRQKEMPLAQDDNPNHLPAGSPNSTGGEFTTNANAGDGGKNNKAYLKDAIYRADDLFDFLPPSLSFKTLSVLKVLPSLSKETIGWLEKHFAEEEAEKAFAGAETWIGKEGKDLSNFFEKKGTPQKSHTNKYAEKSHTESQIRQRETEAEQRLSAKNAKALGNIRLRSSLEEHENAGGHMIERHGARSNEGLAKRLEEENAPETSSCFESDRLMEESAERAVEDNAQLIYQWLENPHRIDNLRINVKMPKNIGRSMRKKDRKISYQKEAKFILRKNAGMAENFNFVTGFPI